RMRRHLESLAENMSDPGKALAQIGPALAGLPDDQGAAAALSIAHQYARRGQWLLAREAYLLMVDRYPAHPLTADAYRWLIRYSASSEARRRHELGQFLVLTTAEVVGTHFEPDRTIGKKEVVPAKMDGTTETRVERE